MKKLILASILTAVAAIAQTSGTAPATPKTPAAQAAPVTPAPKTVVKKHHNKAKKDVKAGASTGSNTAVTPAPASKDASKAPVTK